MVLTSFWQNIADSFINNFVNEQRYKLILDGLGTTMTITVFAVILGTLLGGLICWMRMSRRKWVQNIAKVYIEIMRGTPVLVMLMIMYYVVMAPANASGVTVAIITFAMNTSAYMSEMLRTSIEGIDRGQTEAGLSLGFTKTQTFFNIVLPQAVRNVIPVYTGEVISLLKSTSIVGYVAVMDITKASDIIRARTFDAFFPLITIAIIYFIIAWLLGLLLKSLAKPRHRKASHAAALLPIMLIMFTSCGGNTAGGAVTCEEDMQGKRIAALNGSLAEQFILDDYGAKCLMSFNTDVDATQAVLKGQADAFMIDDIVSIMPLREHAELDTIPCHYAAMPIGACFGKSNTALADAFERFITELTASGDHDEIFTRWMLGDMTKAHRDIEETAAGEPLKVAIMATTPPMNFIQNGIFDGYEPELARLFAKELGRPVEFMNMDFGGILPSIASGKVDIALASISISEERSRMVIQKPYSKSHIVMMFRKPVEAASEDGAGAWVWLLIAIAAAACAIAALRMRKPKGAAAMVEMPDKDTVIKVSHLQKTYNGNLKVLKDVNAEVRKGEVISIIGPSGTGKSTFLRCLNLLERPDAGSIIIDGQDILAPGANVPFLRRKMGMVFQSFNLFNGRSIIENITFAPMKLLGKSREEAEAKAMELLALVGLAQKADAYPEQLSGGQKQRVAIARALAMEPEIILFDEPTSALDPTMVSEVLGVIRTLAKKGLTMLIVTHEMHFAKEVSSRIFYMDEGLVYEEGTPEQIFHNPQKENTRKFINRIHECSYDIESEKYDYYEMMARINSFCVKYNMSSKAIDHIAHIVEEGLLVTKAVAGTNVKVSYSEKTDSKEVCIHTPRSIDMSALEIEENSIQRAILTGICKEISITPDASGSLLRCLLD